MWHREVRMHGTTVVSLSEQRMYLSTCCVTHRTCLLCRFQQCTEAVSTRWEERLLTDGTSMSWPRSSAAAAEVLCHVVFLGLVRAVCGATFYLRWTDQTHTSCARTCRHCGRRTVAISRFINFLHFYSCEV